MTRVAHVSIAGWPGFFDGRLCVDPGPAQNQITSWPGYYRLFCVDPGFLEPGSTHNRRKHDPGQPIIAIGGWFLLPVDPGFCNAFQLDPGRELWHYNLTRVASFSITTWPGLWTLALQLDPGCELWYRNLTRVVNSDIATWPGSWTLILQPDPGFLSLHESINL